MIKKYRYALIGLALFAFAASIPAGSKKPVNIQSDLHVAGDISDTASDAGRKAEAVLLNAFCSEVPAECKQFCSIASTKGQP